MSYSTQRIYLVHLATNLKRPLLVGCRVVDAMCGAEIGLDCGWIVAIDVAMYVGGAGCSVQGAGLTTGRTTDTLDDTHRTHPMAILSHTLF